ncbi:MAG: helix-turn-helix domain-containing protein [Anaerolineae bacterium]|nr:MAG: helix-turn-helix domain-containing protein [Anaerolineae bacterium]
MPSEWLSLSNVAELLGVHPSTVRNWADQQRLPVHRTQGGHRRFRRAEVELWMKSQQAETREKATVMAQSALGYARMQISEAHLEAQPWYRKLDDTARSAYRRSGRDLMQGLMRFQTMEGTEAVREAHGIGVDYANIGRRSGLTLLEASQAFLFFRTVLQNSTFHVYEAAGVNAPLAWGEMLRKINEYTDHILLALLETYESFRPGDSK